MQTTEAIPYDRVARVMKAAAQPIRLAILHGLRDGQQCVGEITRLVGAQRSNVSRHLAVLTNAGVLTSRRQGLMVFYSLKTPCILRIFECVGEVIESDRIAAAAKPCAANPSIASVGAEQ